jgi:hypothetical protein
MGFLLTQTHGLFTDSMTQKLSLSLSLYGHGHLASLPAFSSTVPHHRGRRTLEDLGKWVPLLGSKSPLSSTAPSSFLLLSLTQERAQLEGASGPRLPSPWSIFPSSLGKKISMNEGYWTLERKEDIIFCNLHRI